MNNWEWTGFEAKFPGSLRKPHRRTLDRLNERPRRERLCQVRNAPRLHRGRANGIAVVGGNVDHRERDPGLGQPVPDLDSGLAIQLDIENDADCSGEIVVILKRLCGLKEQTVVAVLSKQPFKALENARIIVDYKD
jgi:hypothetical protein